MSGLNEQEKQINNVIGILATLVISITFVGYVSPPGGNEPYWESCLYPIYVAFVFFSGMAFLGSLGAMAIVVVVTRLYPSTKRLSGANKWIGWGLGMVVASSIMVTVAFVLAGLVTVGFRAPSRNCAVLHCKDGGVACKPDPDPMASLLAMNEVKGECFFVSRIASGRSLSETHRGKYFLRYHNDSINGVGINGTGEIFDLEGCFLVLESLRQSYTTYSRRPSTWYSSNTNRVLCMTLNSPYLEAASKASRESGLRAMGNLWMVDNRYLLQIYIGPLTNCYTPLPDRCLCSHHMAMRPDDLTFVTYTRPLYSPQVYLARIVGQQDDSHVNMSYNEDLDSNHIRNVFGHGVILYDPAIFWRRDVAVFDELQYRCSDAFDAGKPTLCQYSRTARDSAMKWYKPVAGSKGDFHRMCGKQPQDVNFSNENIHACDGLAVDTDGKAILINDLEESGSEVSFSPGLHTSKNTIAASITFSILGMAIAVYLVIAVIVAFAYNGWPLPCSEKGRPIK